MSLKPKVDTKRADAQVRQTAMPEEFLDKADQRAVVRAQRAADARRSSVRRRLVDPTTCERDYSTAELEFMQAMHAYKRASGNPFPSWREVLAVTQKLGYRKLTCQPACVPS